ncbi:MAG: hypothetical protein GY943_20690 [Chloroflexi bacterium]|nr:hypothetical protein [Chloroflexota bacterium]
MTETTRTRTDRVYIDESASEIYRQLKNGPNTQPEESPFETFKDIFMQAVCLGFENGRRIRSGKQGSEIRLTVFTEDDIAILKAIAIADTGDVEVLTSLSDILTIAEEYANAGIHEVKAYLIDESGRSLWNLVDLMIESISTVPDIIT